MYYVKVELYPGVCRKYEIDKIFKIGRHQKNELVLSDTTASHHHANIEVKDDSIWVEDLDSSNGTLVNGAIVHKRFLEENDHIVVGHTNLWIGVEKPQGEVIHVGKLQTDKLNELVDCNDIILECTSTPEEIELLLLLMKQKLSIVMISYGSYLEALNIVVDNICELYAEKPKTFLCRIRYENDSVTTTFTNDGIGIDYGALIEGVFSKKLPEEEKGIMDVINKTDVVVFNRAGNEISLTQKTRQTTIRIPDRKKKFADLAKHIDKVDRKMRSDKVFTTKKQIAINCPTLLRCKKHETVDITITNKDMSENIDDISLIKIIPIFPGCICSPPFREINKHSKSSSIDFSIVPISSAKEQKGKIEIEEVGQTIYCHNFLFTAKEKHRPIMSALGFLIAFVSLLLSPWQFSDIDIKMMGLGIMIFMLLLDFACAIRSFTPEFKCTLNEVEV